MNIQKLTRTDALLFYHSLFMISTKNLTALLSYRKVLVINITNKSLDQVKSWKMFKDSCIL